MNLLSASNELYSLIALDKKLRDELFKDLVANNVAVCFLLSIGTHYSYKKLKVVPTGSTINYPHQLYMLLHNKDVFKTFGLAEQVVLKEVLSKNSKTFNSTVFFSYAIKVFTKAEIEEELQKKFSSNDRIPYILLDASSGRKKLFTSKLNRYGTVILDTNKNVVGLGGTDLDAFLKGKSLYYGQLGETFRYKNSLVEIQYVVNNSSKDVAALVIGREGPMLLQKRLQKAVFNIFEFSVDDSYNVNGVFIEFLGKAYKVKCNVPQYIIDSGTSKYNIEVFCNITLQNKLNNIKFSKFVLKDEYEDD